MVVWISILFNEATKCIDATFKGDNGHMVSASRKWGCQVPLIGLRFIDVVVAPVDAPFAIAAYDIRHALGDVPLVGFFAAGEIARHHLYGYTGVLTVFTDA